MRARLRHQNKPQHQDSFGDFYCMNCHQFVSSDTLVSGVHNRNHCPYCLSSRHLDLFKPGDRLSACKAGMKPVAITLKRTAKKYSVINGGEIMLVHQCLGCGKISINRIAADDNLEAIMEVFDMSCHRKLFERLPKQEQIDTLTSNDRPLLQVQLTGRS